jgi:cytochrome oxidase assembly protein ShyY1
MAASSEDGETDESLTKQLLNMILENNAVTPYIVMWVMIHIIILIILLYVAIRISIR